MVVPIRELGNITPSTSAIYSTTNNITLIQDSDMVFEPLDNLLSLDDKFDKVRDCSLVLSVHRPRSSSMSSSECDKEYHICVKRDNDRMNENEPATSIDSIQVEYAS